MQTDTELRIALQQIRAELAALRVERAGWTGTEGAACVITKAGPWCLGKNVPIGGR